MNKLKYFQLIILCSKRRHYRTGSQMEWSRSFVV